VQWLLADAYCIVSYLGSWGKLMRGMSCEGDFDPRSPCICDHEIIEAIKVCIS